MNQYKHYSFDLWGTLIKSNPEFKKKRAEYIWLAHNPSGCTLLHVETVIRDVDIMCNTINETTGGNIDAYEMYGMVLHKLHNTFDKDKLETVYHDVERFFYEYPPKLYDENTLVVLQKLRENGATISILSNTAFIRGKMLREVVDHNLGIARYMDFQVYSDEENASKPNKLFFDKIKDRLWLKYRHYKNDVAPNISEIIHIGDNPLADYEGATAYGFDAMLINSNDKTIKDVLYQEQVLVA